MDASIEKSKILDEAVSAFEIDVPVMAWRPLDGGRLELSLYGGRVVVYTPSKPVTSSIGELNHPAVRDLESMKLPELRELAKKLGLNVSGLRKDVIIERIRRGARP